MKKSYKIDFLNFTVREGGLPAVLALFHSRYPHELKPSETGFYGYKFSYRAPGALVLFSPCRDDVHVQLSGEGCDLVGDALQFVPSGAKITRLDIAMDVYDGEFTVEDVWGYLQRGQKVCSSTTFLRLHGLVSGDGDTIYIGSKSSERRLRIYDKAAESKLPSVNWVRYELQLRSETASAVFAMLYAGSLDEVFRGVCLKSLRLLERVPADGENITRIPLLPAWERLFESSPTITLSLPRHNKHLAGAMSYIRNAGAVLRFLKLGLCDFDEFLEECMSKELRDHHKMLLDELLQDQQVLSMDHIRALEEIREAQIAETEFVFGVLKECAA